jgi:3-methyladenine DNA glycosylase/8-oxoguanine DNA glycosylase
LFGRSPASLRKARGDDEDGSAGLILRLSFAPPYDWASIMRTLAERAIAGVEQVSPAVYRRTIGFGDAAGSMSVAPDGEDRLRVELDFAKLDALPEIAARVRALFDLAADLQILQQHLGGNPLLAPLISARPGLRVAGCWDGFELVVRTVFGERLGIPASPSAIGRFVLAFGEPLGNPAGGLTYVFPPPERLRDADLHALLLTKAQASAIKSYVEATTIATRFARQTDDISGIDERLHARFESWRPWRAYAAQHLLMAGRLDVGENYLHAA